MASRISAARVVDKNIQTFDFMRQKVQIFFTTNPKLNSSIRPIIHSVKSRIKSSASIKKKLLRKNYQFASEQELLDQLTDIAGVRVIHYAPRQIIDIDAQIREQVAKGEWILAEDPKAYTWDVEMKSVYESLKLKTEIKDSAYSSVHYLVKSNESGVICEIQVRNLFEEAWSEIDHMINYPEASKDFHQKEYLLVLSRLVSAASRLSDSILTKRQK